MSSDQAAPSDSTLQGQYAGFVSRLSALIVDILLITGTLVIVGLAVQLILRFFNLDEMLSNAINDLENRYRIVDSAVRVLAALGSFYFVFFIYYIVLHTVAGGMTIGKALMGLRVVRMDGTMLSVGRCTRRYVFFLLSALPLFLGLLWVIVDDRRQGWHDKLSGTCVIYDWPAQEDESFLVGLRNRLSYAQETRGRGASSDADNNDQSQPAETVPAAENIT